MEKIIEQFRHKGRLFIWNFHPENRNSPGWNLTGDTEGCSSLMELLEHMQGASFSSRKTIAIERATARQVKVITGAKPYKWVTELHLQYKKGEPQLWYTEEKEERLHITFGEREIDLLQTALQRIIKGEGDFAIGDSGQQHLLYFWWFLEGA